MANPGFSGGRNMSARARFADYFLGCMVLVGGLPASCLVSAQEKPAAKLDRPIRVLFPDLGSHSKGVDARLRKLKFDVVVVPWAKFDPDKAPDIDVIFLPTYWAGEVATFAYFEGKKEAVHRFVRRGGGLVVCQPNADSTPTLLPYPITFQNHYDSKAPGRVNLGHDHFITEDLPDQHMPFPADPMLEVDPRYRVLAKHKSTGWASLAVCAFDDGRVVVQTANESYAADIPLTDEILRRMIVWAAGREPRAQSGLAPGDDSALRRQANQGLAHAVAFFRKYVATEGGYLWRYSVNLAEREGEGKATRTQVWVQPPGTPAVGMALLSAYEATGERAYLDAAIDAARCLVRGQLRSGGWDYSIEFDPKRRKLFAYRTDEARAGAKNVSTLDDNTTQAALRFLMRVDRALAKQDPSIHEAVQFGLDALVKAQYPNGAWPQRFDDFPDAAKFPVKKASYPGSWSRTFPGADYRGYYTFNDNTIADVIDTMFDAARLYGDPKYVRAVEKAGDFMILAQMPDPQPGWAQQYNLDMHPAWARKFEPAAISGGESQGVMLALLKLYRATGGKKYLEPLPRALAYYRKSLLPDGRLARFYELKTNKPLYFTTKYELTYKDDDLPTHYGFKVGSRLDAIVKEYERVRDLDPAALQKPERPRRPQVSENLRKEVKSVLAALDQRGRWIEEARLKSVSKDTIQRVIECRTFIRNVEVLSEFLAATKP
jgi:PelA/Pel-15E family pectate lyase